MNGLFVVVCVVMIVGVLGWQKHREQFRCRYCGNYYGNHDNHCPYQGSSLWG